MALDAAWAILKNAPAPNYARGTKGVDNVTNFATRDRRRGVRDSKDYADERGWSQDWSNRLHSYYNNDEDQNRDLLAAKRFQSRLKPKKTRTALEEGEGEPAKWDSKNRDVRLANEFDPTFRMKSGSKHVERMPRPDVGPEASFQTQGVGGGVFEPAPAWQGEEQEPRPSNYIPPQ